MTAVATVAETVDRLLAERRPFAVFRLPGEDISIAVRGGDLRVALCPWNTPRERAVAVTGDSPIEATPDAAVWHESTDRQQYAEALERVIASHTPESGKTVISRAICMRTAERGWGEVFGRLMDAFPTSFVYVTYTPATGSWMGATPELLADISDGRLTTMALAGTRPAGTGGPWDVKNLREHAMVADFIRDTLAEAGAEVSVKPVTTLSHGMVEHLMTPVEAALPVGLDIDMLLDRLSPTPAVAGLPRDRAIEQIAQAERHPRRLYAGYIDIDEGRRRRCYVNLRCMQFDPDSGDVCIYAGGGITALSDVASEWQEASAKSLPLKQILGL